MEPINISFTVPLWFCWLLIGAFIVNFIMDIIQIVLTRRQLKLKKEIAKKRYG